MDRSHFVGTALLLALTLSACDIAGTLGPAEPPGAELLADGLFDLFGAQTQGPNGSHAPGGPPGGGSLFADLAASIPGFGGLYRTGECEVVVVLTDMSQAQLAQQVVHAALAPIHPCHGLVQVGVVQGQFTYNELQRYLAASRPLLEIEGVHGIRIDYQLNRLVVTVGSREAARLVTEALHRLGIPVEAVVFEAGRPASPPQRPTGTARSP